MSFRALGRTVSEEEVNRVLGAVPMRGASWEQAMACAQHFGFRGTLIVPCPFSQLVSWVNTGTPVIISWNPEGREWSHASVVYDVIDESQILVADPNCPDPAKTTRVVSREDFFKKWSEKWPDYIVRRPALAIQREIVDGIQVQARKVAAGYLKSLRR